MPFFIFYINYIMPRPGNIRLRRARYADLSGGPMKFGLAPTVGKGHHFWRLNRTGGGPKCCKPPLLPHSLELTFDASNGAILYVKFDHAVTTMTKLTGLSESNFRTQFKVRHKNTDDNHDISFVNIKDLTVGKAYFNTSKNKLDSMPNAAGSTSGKIGKYLVLELDTTANPNHIPMLGENYVVEYTPSTSNKNLRVIMSGGDSGELRASKQKGEASNSFDFKITDISGGSAATEVIVTFSHDIAESGINAKIMSAFTVVEEDTDTTLDVTGLSVSGKKATLTISAYTSGTRYKVTYDPLAITKADQNGNYLKINNTNNVQNYRVHEVSRTDQFNN
jgi:hypothetical protein